MAVMKCIFKRPVKLGGVIYQKSRRPQDVAEEHLKSSFMKALMESGDVAVLAAKAADEVADEVADKKPAKKK